jgi:hypothetical protein
MQQLPSHVLGLILVIETNAPRANAPSRMNGNRVHTQFCVFRWLGSFPVFACELLHLEATTLGCTASALVPPGLRFPINSSGCERGFNGKHSDPNTRSPQALPVSPPFQYFRLTPLLPVSSLLEVSLPEYSNVKLSVRVT